VARSWLFAPGHSERLLAKVFDAGADEVLLDLEDGVGPEFKDRARSLVSEALGSRPAWVRINAPRTEAAEADLKAVAAQAKGIRIPKVESATDVDWVRKRLDGRDIPLSASIESARGVLGCLDIAAAPGVVALAFGNVDFAADMAIASDAWEGALFARSQLVLVSRAAGIDAPSDGVYTHFEDDEGLRAEALRVRAIGFSGKSAIHPRQVPIINEVFSPSAAELTWATEVVQAYEASQGAATRTASGEMVDVPVFERARRILSLAAPVTEP
jgi:citrate lyase subunit beta/citryl-CoA lyase